ncbi:hypothetical protein C7293_18740 [filamentous cyanobacterium CCT1]|nr:hypothetical protein C7293_18740 [filamentous cyanobacterium CCT1]PSN78500.1 hypothetical protein C8B47_16570 [filamentous cyanobacterium CCP4]
MDLMDGWPVMPVFTGIQSRVVTYYPVDARIRENDRHDSFSKPITQHIVKTGTHPFWKTATHNQERRGGVAGYASINRGHSSRM